MKTKHTKLPWKFQDEYIRADALTGEHGNMVADPYCLPSEEYADEMAANAAFIVKACNAHDDLVAALERLHEYANLVRLEIDDQATGWYYQLGAAIDNARKMLAKAKG